MLKQIMKKYRAAVIGTGRIGFSLENDGLREQPASHASALSGHPSVTLAAGCDIDPVNLKAFHKKYPHTNIYSDADMLMRQEKPDLVSVAVDESAHLKIMETICVHRPGLVILEKPVAPNTKDAKKISAICRRFHVPVCINHERRFSIDYMEARKLLAKGRIGIIHSVRANLWGGGTVWKDSARKDGTCSLLHDGTHLVDILRFLLGKELVKAHVDHYTKNKKGDIDSLYCRLTAGKVLVNLEFCGNKRAFDFGMEFSGSKGKLAIGNGFFRVYTSKPSPYYSGFHSLARDRNVKRPFKTGYFRNMVSNCVDFLDGKNKLNSTLEEGLKTLSILYNIADLITGCKK